MQASCEYQVKRHQLVSSARRLDDYRNVNHMCLEELRKAMRLLADTCKEVSDLCMLMKYGPVRERLLQIQYCVKRCLDMFLNKSAKRIGWRELPVVTISCMKKRHRDKEGDCLQAWAKVIEKMEMVSDVMNSPCLSETVFVPPHDDDSNVVVVVDDVVANKC